MDKKRNRESGQALILIAIGIVGLLGMLALAIDGGNVFMDRRNAQNAADAAVFAAAYAKLSGVDLIAAGQDIATSNGYNNDGVRSVVTINNPPGEGCKGIMSPFSTDEKYIQVVIDSFPDPFFAPVVGINQFHNCVEAIVHLQLSEGEEMFWGNAIVSLNPDGCTSFDVGGTADGTIYGGGIFVNSANECVQGAFRQRGKSMVSFVPDEGEGGVTSGVCTNGSYNYEVGGLIPAEVYDCGGLVDEDAYLYPYPVCSTDAAEVLDEFGAPTGDWTPGNILGASFSGTMNLGPGIYCIDGNVNFNAGDVVIGDGVLLFVMNGKFTINGGSHVELSALTIDIINANPSLQDQGLEDYVGLLIYLPPSNSNPVEINGNSGSFFVGTILAPASLIKVNGTEEYYDIYSQIIGWDVELTGTGNLTIHYNDELNYDGMIPPIVRLTK